MRTAAGSNGMPIAWNSAALQPAPRPSSTRPPASTSSVAISLASTTGWRRSLARMNVLSRMTVVAAAAAVSAGSGGELVPQVIGQ